MGIVSLLLTLLKVVSALLDFLERRRLLSEGELRAVRTMQEEIDEKVERARVARDRVSHDADSVSSDPNNRDNTGPGAEGEDG